MPRPFLYPVFLHNAHTLRHPRSHFHSELTKIALQAENYSKFLFINASGKSRTQAYAVLLPRALLVANWDSLKVWDH